MAELPKEKPLASSAFFILPPGNSGISVRKSFGARFKTMHNGRL